MRIAQVAYMAGYTEAAPLVRAFKRWTGTTPRPNSPDVSAGNFSLL